MIAFSRLSTGAIPTIAIPVAKCHLDPRSGFMRQCAWVDIQLYKADMPPGQPMGQGIWHRIDAKLRATGDLRQAHHSGDLTLASLSEFELEKCSRDRQHVMQ